MLRRRSAPAEGPLDLPGYTDLTVIGHGSSGVVYRAYQPHLDRVVAIKVVLADLSGDDLLARWERECRATGRLSRHPYIVTVLDAGVSPAGRPYLVMDWYPRGSLAASLHEGGPMSVSPVLSLGVRLAGALETAHRTGILHRDVKPENVLLGEFGEPVLADFGIAGIAGTATAQLGPRALTPVHAAPEVLDDKPATTASDTYSLGSVLYTALAGRAAYQAGTGEGLAALLARVISQPLPPIGRADVPAAVEEAVAWAMSKDPAGRPTSAAALGQRLQQLQVQLQESPTELVLTAPTGTSSASVSPPSDPHRAAGPPGDRERAAGIAISPPGDRERAAGIAISPPGDTDRTAGLAAAPPRDTDRTAGLAVRPGDAERAAGTTVPRPARRDPETLPPAASSPPMKPPATPTSLNQGPPPPAYSGPGTTGTVARPSRRGRVPESPPAPAPAAHPGRRWLRWVIPGAVGVAAAVVGVVVAGAIGGGPSPPPTTTLVVNQALAPTDLTVTTLGHSSVQLRWHDNAGGRYPFVVLYDPSLPDGHASDPISAGTTSYLVTGLRANQRTCFRVALVNSGDEKAWPTSPAECVTP